MTLFQRALQALLGLDQLAFEAVNLVRNLGKLIFGGYSCFGDPMRRPVRFAHGTANLNRYPGEFIFLGHVVLLFCNAMVYAAPRAVNILKSQPSKLASRLSHQTVKHLLVAGG